MTAKKIFPVFLILLTVSMVFMAFVHAVSPADRFIAREIEHCRLEKFDGNELSTEEQCKVWDVVVGHAYELTLAPEMEERETPIKLPVDTEATNSDFIERAKIPCNDPEGIAVAKLNKDTWKWEVLSSSSIAEEEQEEGRYRLGARVASEGIYAVIVKDPFDRERIAEFSAEGKICQRISCGSYKGFETDPYTGNAKQGTPIKLSFCNILTGCDASAEKGTNEARACAQGVNSFNPSFCTPDEDKTDCCVPVLDGFCDPDCWKVDLEGEPIDGMPEEGVAVKDSTDSDCLIGMAELYGLEEAKDKDIFGKVKPKKASKSLEHWKDTPYTKEYTPPMLFEGPITVQVEGEGVIFFKNFSYTDLEGKEHLLFPLYPATGWLDASPGHEDLIKARSEAVFYPHIWYQREIYNFVDGAMRVQFDLPPTGVRNFSVYATTKDKGEPSFTFTGTAYEGDADPDHDNSSNYDDCHDNNPNINPIASEECNGLDDNCNGYRKYYPFEGDVWPEIDWRITPKGSDCDPGNDKTYIRDNFLRMPCDGFLEFTGAQEGAYLEVWEKETCESCSSPNCKTEGEYKSISCDAAGLNGMWNKYSAIFAYGDDIDDDPGFGCCWEEDNSDEYCDAYGCAIGAHASCKAGALPGSLLGIPRSDNTYQSGDCERKIGTSYLGPDDSFAILNQKGKSLAGFGAITSTSPRELNSVENRVKLKKDDMIWGRVIDWGDSFDNCGLIRFKVHCNKEIDLHELDDEGKTAEILSRFPLSMDMSDISPGDYRVRVRQQIVDEGMTECLAKTQKMNINVCPAPKLATDTYVFNELERRCVDEPLCPPDITNLGNFSCLHDIAAEENPGMKKFEVWVCPEGEKCFRYYKGGFNVCLAREECSGVINPALNLDLDCDGLTPYTPVTNEAGEITGMDRTKPLDPDCMNVSIVGDCDFTNKKWYKSEAERYVTDGYCLQCGDRDSTCTKVCEEGQKSCDGGCLQDAYDVAGGKNAGEPGMWCNAGAWTSKNYCTKYGKNDSDCFDTSGCRANACDIVSNETCYRSRWDNEGGDSKPYCEVLACRGKDAECSGTCVAGTCDVYANAYCRTGGTWSINDAPDYCAECGAIDADCGTKECASDTCDITNHKVCSEGEWKAGQIDYCNKCDELDSDYCNPSCPAEGTPERTNTELNCTDKLDNDCDGWADCNDRDDCGILTICAEPPCPYGDTGTCGNNQGICTQGTHTCGIDGRWGECILPPGGRLAEIEICNGEWDDNCDDTIDEGCVCTTGESMVCGQDSGSCRAGVKRCVDGKWGYCYRSSRSSPTTEICDTFDNDCDGDIDEACPCDERSNQTCGGAAGTICKAGLRTCNDGVWGVCAGETKPLTENSNIPGTCTDSIDNDCDGKTDAADDTCSVTPLDQLAALCFDLKKNQDETGIDCGGKCPPCSAAGPQTCNNKRMDGDEEGRDCGGSCSIACDEKLRVRSASSEEDTADDTITEPVCGDMSCDDGEECPEDCETSTTTPLSGFLIPGIIILVIIGGAFAAYKAGFIKMKGKQQTKQAFPTPKGMPSSPQQSAKPSVSSGAFKAAPQTSARKEIKSKEELELEKSFKEESELLKK